MEGITEKSNSTNDLKMVPFSFVDMIQALILPTKLTLLLW